MPRSTTTGIFTRVANTFSNPVVGTVIDQDDADELFDDYDSGLFGYDLAIVGLATGVNLNSANTDTDIQIRLPLGSAIYRLNSIFIINNGATASLTTATGGLFTGTGGAGLALAANQALSAITSNIINTDANMMALTATIGARTWLGSTTLRFRVGTAQGAASSADVYIFANPFPA